jgi:hypothetical protein
MLEILRIAGEAPISAVGKVPAIIAPVSGDCPFHAKAEGSFRPACNEKRK